MGKESSFLTIIRAQIEILNNIPVFLRIRTVVNFEMKVFCFPADCERSVIVNSSVR